MNAQFWQGKKVFLTGHTGFKGGWLALWLAKLGAEVHGYTFPNLFTVAGVEEVLSSSTIADIRDSDALSLALQASGAEVVFHLAAQPLVRYSYAEPVETYATNVMGTVNLLEAIRHIKSVKTVVNVTTDKCYENREWVWPYREEEAMGGHDPYSSSKACSEIVTAAYRRSFLAEQGVAVASARAGNVIGGGDWSVDRLVPDFLKAMDAKQSLLIRSPNAIRPWQHVLEPLSGYIMLAENLSRQPNQFSEAWNFGPAEDDARTVQWIVEQLVAATPGAVWEIDGNPQLHEAGYLKLDSSKARARLDWKPRWNLKSALNKTIEWHTAWRGGQNMQQVTSAQIRAYQDTAQVV